jgi:hypothetical protein
VLENKSDDYNMKWFKPILSSRNCALGEIHPERWTRVDMTQPMLKCWLIKSQL